MMNLICSIPDHIGWALVGGAVVLCTEMLGLLVGTLVEMWREWHEEEESEVM